jgi:hypothetical protein
MLLFLHYFIVNRFIISFNIYCSGNQCGATSPTTQATTTTEVPTTTTPVTYYEDKIYSAYLEMVDEEYNVTIVEDFIKQSWIDANDGN